MKLSTSALSWAALRSGLPLNEFLSSLTPEAEESLFIEYNAWRRSKGLPEELPVPETPPNLPKINKTASVCNTIPTLEIWRQLKTYTEKED